MDKSRKEMAKAYKSRKVKGGVFAVRNSVSGKSLIMKTADMDGSRNRFEFAKATGGCAFKQIEEDFKKYGAGAFTFEALEEIEKKQGQTDSQFEDELDALLTLVTEGEDPGKLY